MAGKIAVNKIQLGDSVTATQNFVLQTNTDGTVTLARGNDGATTQELEAQAAALVKLEAIAEVKADALMQAMAANTPLQNYQYVQNNVTNLTEAKHILGKLAAVIGTLL